MEIGEYVDLPSNLGSRKKNKILWSKIEKLPIGKSLPIYHLTFREVEQIRSNLFNQHTAVIQKKELLGLKVHTRTERRTPEDITMYIFFLKDENK